MGTMSPGKRIAARGRVGVRLLVLCVWLVAGGRGFGQAKTDGKPGTQARPVFTEADAVRVLDQMRQAFESHNRSRFLKLFDTRRMPGFAVFRDEMDEFFETYHSIRMNYQLTQVTTDGEFGGLMMNMTLEAAPSEAGTPGVRRDVQARFLLAWDGKGWKIADLAPRNLFKTGS